MKTAHGTMPTHSRQATLCVTVTHQTPLPTLARCRQRLLLTMFCSLVSHSGKSSLHCVSVHKALSMSSTLVRISLVVATHRLALTLKATALSVQSVGRATSLRQPSHGTRNSAYMSLRFLAVTPISRKRVSVCLAQLPISQMRTSAIIAFRLALSSLILIPSSLSLLSIQA